VEPIGYSCSYRPRHATGEWIEETHGAFLPALALSPWSWPHPHGRTPTIPPVFSNARRSMTRHQPLRGRGIIPPDKRKTRPESAPAAAATIIATGAIHGRNHAEPIVHPHILGESGRLPPRRVARSPIVKALPSRGAMRAWSSDMKIGPRTYSRSLQCSAQRVCSIFVLGEPRGNRSKLAPTSD
jgi:hypothetical protein